ncbi:hypothetical protein PG984_003414 [Apiospora sp. TS-2023a]
MDTAKKLQMAMKHVRSPLHIYKVYIRFWPLTRQERFNMKALWLKEDHSKPYPFPGHEVTYENIRERTFYNGNIVPNGFFLKVATSDTD